MPLKKLQFKGASLNREAILLTLTTALVCVGVLGVLFFVLAFVLTKFDLPLYTVTPLSTVAICIATFAAGVHLVGKVQRRGMLNGFLTGLAVCAVLVVFALLKGTFTASEMAGLKLVAICCSGAIGGYYGILKSEKKRIAKHT